MEVQEVLQDIQDPRHLGEDQNFVTLGMQVLQEGRQTLEFSTIVLNQVFVREE